MGRRTKPLKIFKCINNVAKIIIRYYLAITDVLHTLSNLRLTTAKQRHLFILNGHMSIFKMRKLRFKSSILIKITYLEITRNTIQVKVIFILGNPPTK